MVPGRGGGLGLGVSLTRTRTLTLTRTQVKRLLSKSWRPDRKSNLSGVEQVT